MRIRYNLYVGKITMKHARNNRRRLFVWMLVAVLVPAMALGAQNKKKKGKNGKKKKKKKKKKQKKASKKEARQAIKKFKKAVKEAEKTSDVVVAAKKLGNTRHPLVADFILKVFDRSEKKPVLQALLNALASAGDFRDGPDLAKRLKAFRGKQEMVDVYTDIISTLGKLGSRRVYNNLRSAFNNDTHGYISASAEAARAIAELNDWRGIDKFINRMEQLKREKVKWEKRRRDPPEDVKKRFNELWPAIRHAMQKMTGKNIADADRWRQWYSNNRDKVQKKIKEQQKKEKKKWKKLKRKKRKK